MTEYNPDWEQCEYVNLDRKWQMLEWLYINPDAEYGPEFVFMCCSWDEFCNSIHDALKSSGDFWEHFGGNHREYYWDRRDEEFSDVCDFIENTKHDFVFDKAYEDKSMIWPVMAIFAEMRGGV